MSQFLQAFAIWAAQALWSSMPFFITVAVMQLTMVPMHLMGGFPPPDIGLIAAFFWAVYGPQMFPAPAIFAMGLIQDFATASPPGFWAFIYLAVWGFTVSQRVFFIGRSVVGVWLGFAAVALITAIVVWILGSTIYNRWLPPTDIFVQAAVTAFVFPVFGRLFLMLRRMLTTAPERL